MTVGRPGILTPPGRLKWNVIKIIECSCSSRFRVDKGINDAGSPQEVIIIISRNLRALILIIQDRFSHQTGLGKG